MPKATPSSSDKPPSSAASSTDQDPELSMFVRDATTPANECGYCGKLFICVGTRKRHEHEIHENRFRYQCDICGQGAHGMKELEGHKALHTRDDDVYMHSRCEECGLRFQFSRQLKFHMRKYHTGV